MQGRRLVVTPSKHRIVFPAAVLALLAPLCWSEEQLPQWKVVASIGLSGTWERAADMGDVVVGGASNVVAVGSQRISNPPWPVSVDEIYWCKADFHASAVVKGRLPTPGKPFLWAAIRPGCGFEWFRYGYDETEAPFTQVWFVREEGEYIRPVVDAGGVFFISFHGKWFDPPEKDAPTVLALLMLNPAALGMTPSHYAVIFHYAVTLARTILGEEETVKRLKALATSQDPAVRTSVCSYLDSQFRQPCR
jgi:hypothetical protein